MVNHDGVFARDSWGGFDGVAKPVERAARRRLLGPSPYGRSRAIGLKRALDLCLIIATLPIVASVVALTALLIWLEDRGPVFFIQERVGYRGRRFRMIKLRSMRPAAPATVACADQAARALETRENDDRITRVGRVIRRTRIDELPQLVNVLRGEMSIVGPRPEAVALSQKYRRAISGYAERHMVLPGLTGLAQISQGHVTSVDDVAEKLRWDIAYVRSASLLLDLKILMRTVGVLVGGFGAR